MATNKDFVVKNGLQVGANTSIEGSITTVDSVQFDANAGITVSPGQLAWNADAGTLDLGITDDVTLQVGQETHVHVKAGEAITNGDVVYASGAVGNSGQIEVSKFIADGTIEERRVIGIATESAASGEFFYVTTFGSVGGISTDGSAVSETWNDGDILYASPTTAGALTNTLPVAPNPDIAIAFVTSAHASNGKLFVRAYDPGFHLSEIHDVYINAVADNNLLAYSTANGRWENTNNITVNDIDITGSVTGNLTVDGNLIVSGNTTTVNTNELSVEDLNITIASGANTAADADGAGLTITGANVALAYNATDDALDLNNTLMFSSGRDGYLTNTLPGIYRAFSTTGTYPFDRYGDLVIQARSSHARDILFVTGLSPTNRMVISENGNVGIGSEFSASVVPNHPLHLYNSTATTMRIQGSNKNMYLTANTTGTFIEHNQFVPLTISTHDSTIKLSTDDGATAALTVNTNDSVTIPTLHATTVNATTLNGAFGNTAVTIGSTYGTTPSTGNMWFDNLNLKLKIYDGSNWQDAVPAGGGGSANTGSTDANSTFSKYTYVLSSATSTVSGADVANNTLSYDTSGIENVEVFVNGVKQVEGSSYDYTATTGISVGFTSTLSAGDVVDVQVYELLTNDAYYLKTETYTQTEVNSQITTALGGYVPATGGTFTGVVQFGDSTGDHTKFGVSATNSMMSFDSTGTNKSGGMTYRADRGNLQILTANTWGGSALSINHIRDDYQLGTTIDEPQTINMRVDGIDFGNIGAYANTSVRSMQLGSGTNGHILLNKDHNGHVAVGGTLPEQDLAIITETNYNAPTLGAHGGNFSILKGDGSASGVYGLLMGVAGTGNSWIQAQRTSGTATAYDIMLQPSGGYVGVGTDPAAKFHVYSGVGRDLKFDQTTNTNATRLLSDRGLQLKSDAGYSLKLIGGSNSSGYGLIEFETSTNGVVAKFNNEGHFLPGTNATYDLGSTTLAWRNIYTNDLHLSNEGHEEGNSVDGTKGNWTIQEGEDHLYIINNKSGKKYRFALEEIE